jgi:hypothetical protein
MTTKTIIIAIMTQNNQLKPKQKSICTVEKFGDSQS